MKLATSLILAAVLATAQKPPRPGPALAERIERADCEVYGIVHWGLNTYTDREWGYGDENPALLAPSDFDADQIAAVSKAGGLAGLIVVAKHHDGFCLWPTKTTAYNITSAKGFRGGKGDYIREMSDACRRHSLKFGVYVSPWDRNSAHYGTPKYTELYHEQIRELLDGKYGEVFEMWFDGANGGDGWYGGAREKRDIGKADVYYRFGELFALVRRLQPSACIFGGGDNSDLRWPGNEIGELDQNSCSSICSTDDDAKGKFSHAEFRRLINTGLRPCDGGTYFRPGECDFPLRPGWFYHARENGKSKCGLYLTKRYLNAVGNAGMLNIGISPDKSGRITSEDAKALADFAFLKSRLFERKVENGPCNIVVMREDVTRQGEAIESWRIVDGDEEILSGTSIGIKRIRVLDKPRLAQNLKIETAGPFKKSEPAVEFYFANEELLKAILNSSTESGETDTAKWMTAAELR